MKTFAELLDEISERESDAAYNMRMRKTARTLKRSAKKGKRKKRLNKLKRKTDYLTHDVFNVIKSNNY